MKNQAATWFLLSRNYDLLITLSLTLCSCNQFTHLAEHLLLCTTVKRFTVVAITTTVASP